MDIHLPKWFLYWGGYSFVLLFITDIIWGKIYTDNPWFSIILIIAMVLSLITCKFKK